MSDARTTIRGMPALTTDYPDNLLRLVINDIAVQVAERTEKGFARALVAASDGAAADIEKAKYTCDGTADEVQINGAISEVSAAGGGVVELSAGNYEVAETILLRDNVTLQGAGMGATVIKLADGALTAVIANSGWAGTGDADVAVRDLSIDGNRGADSANNDPDDFTTGSVYDSGTGNIGTIYFDEVTRGQITRVEVYDPAATAIEVMNSTDILVEDCFTLRSNDDGIAINEGCERCIVRGCTVTESGYNNDYGGCSGIEVQDDAAWVLVDGNYVSASTTIGVAEPTGIRIGHHNDYTAPRYVVVTNNRVHNGSYCVIINSDDTTDTDLPHNIVIANNYLLHNASGSTGTARGIGLINCQYTTVANNTYVKDDSGRLTYMLAVYNALECTVVGNTFSCVAGGDNGQDKAIFFALGPMRNVLIADNTFTNLEHTYIYINSDASLSMTRVILKNNLFACPDSPDPQPSYAVLAYDAAGATVTGCRMENNVFADTVVTGTSMFNQAGASSSFLTDWVIVHPDTVNGSAGTKFLSPAQFNALIGGLERSADPAEPAEGEYVIWMSDGTGKGDDGDILIASKAGGATKYGTLFDHSAGDAW